MKSQRHATTIGLAILIVVAVAATSFSTLSAVEPVAEPPQHVAIHDTIRVRTFEHRALPTPTNHPRTVASSTAPA